MTLLSRLSERHPEKQGLKPIVNAKGGVPTSHFQSVIQKNKD